ncbi:DUF4097 family beta strand repeat-containing protein [Aureibacillus halotolerans]|uniref:Putative adhesin n=1 Tax=Aureibacillus halotolerans TaxID=1508390 RepID=A0A4R6U8L9_9BACI|nr:DUF4097 family beta strand repeat-containing protein [Aureibacillus halotolerans]TDQ42741.1 putative adhesin [Aureibacillus halotolerans]
MTRKLAGFILVALGVLLSIYILFPGLINMEKSAKAEEERTITGDFKRLSITGQSTDVYVSETSGDDILIRYVGKETLQVNEDEAANELRIEIDDDRRGWLTFGMFTRNKLYVSLPGRTMENTNIQTTSGHLSLADIDGGDVRASTTSGDLSLSVIDGENVMAGTNSGDIVVDRGTGETWDLKTSSGDIDVYTGDFSNLKTNTSSGETTLDQVAAETIGHHSSSGDLEGELLQGELTVRTSSGEVEVNVQQLNGNSSVQTSSGDVDWGVQETPASAELNVNSGSGSIDVEGVEQWQTQLNEEHSFQATIGNNESSLKVTTGSGDIELWVNE